MSKEEAKIERHVSNMPGINVALMPHLFASLTARCIYSASRGQPGKPRGGGETAVQVYDRRENGAVGSTREEQGERTSGTDILRRYTRKLITKRKVGVISSVKRKKNLAREETRKFF